MSVSDPILPPGSTHERVRQSGRIAGQQFRSGNLVRRPATPRPPPTPITASASPNGNVQISSDRLTGIGGGVTQLRRGWVGRLTVLGADEHRQGGSTVERDSQSIASRCTHSTRSSEARARTRAAYRVRSASSRRSRHWPLVRHPTAPRHRRPRLLPTQTSRRQEATRGHPLLEAQDLRRHLPPAPRRYPTGRQRRRRHGSGKALRGVTHIQRGRLTPAHRHFGSATSRTREGDATPDRLTTEGSR